MKGVSRHRLLDYYCSALAFLGHPMRDCGPCLRMVPCSWSSVAPGALTLNTSSCLLLGVRGELLQVERPRWSVQLSGGDQRDVGWTPKAFPAGGGTMPRVES